MALPPPPDPVLLVVAAFRRHDDPLPWVRDRLQQEFGPLARAGPVFAFDQTAYYQPTMGPGLRKQLLAFHDLVAADRLAQAKLRTNALEHELAATGTYPEPRPLNLDPG